MPKFSVIIAAAGKGERFGGQEKKTLAKLDGRAVFLRTIERFVRRDDVCETILAVASEDTEALKKTYGANLGFMGVKLVEGGATRTDTVLAALSVVSGEAEFVAIHDAVRPCVSPEQIDAVFDEAGKTGAAILAAPIVGTIKRVSGAGVIEETVPRCDLYEAQTPQVFRKTVLEKAYANRDEDSEDATDDAQMVERFGHPVSVVISDGSNLKITTKPDLMIAGAILKARPNKPKPRFGAFDEAQW